MALATVGDLLDYVRQQLNSEKIGGTDDNALWKDNEIIEYINQAQQEFSRATLCLKDRSSFVLPVVTGTRSYTYSPEILSVITGWLETTQKRIQATVLPDFDRAWILGEDAVERIGDWETETGSPSFIIVDIDSDDLILYPIPIADENLTLYVIKVASAVSAATDALEIPEQYRAGLTLRVMSLAYLKHDVLETENVDRSMMLGKKWESFLQDAKASINVRHGVV